MKLQTKILKVALEWVEKNWKSKQGYNLTMSKTSQKAPDWALGLINDVKEIKKDIIELKKDVAELKKDVALIKTCPTIKKELSELKSSN